MAARRRVDAQTPVAAYEYDGLNRRIRKQVDNSGVGVVPGSDAGGIDGIQAGNLNEHYYYAGWRVIEERDNSASCVAQTVYGTEYIDAPVCRDRNTDVTAGGSPDDDCLDSGGSARYFYHQDANFRVVAMTDESAAVVERYDYDAYGEPRVYAGVSGSAESGALRLASAIGNPYMHQGLRWDGETGLHENRYRSLDSRLGRFVQRDPLGISAGINHYAYCESRPLICLDPLGLCQENQEIGKDVNILIMQLRQREGAFTSIFFAGSSMVIVMTEAGIKIFVLIGSILTPVDETFAAAWLAQKGLTVFKGQLMKVGIFWNSKLKGSEAARLMAELGGDFKKFLEDAWAQAKKSFTAIFDKLDESLRKKWLAWMKDPKAGALDPKLADLARAHLEAIEAQLKVMPITHPDKDISVLIERAERLRHALAELPTP